MTFREAYEALCDFRRGKLVYDDTLEEAIRIYMNEVDELIEEVSSLTVDLRRTKEQLVKERKLKKKYYDSRNKWWEKGGKRHESILKIRKVMRLMTKKEAIRKIEFIDNFMQRNYSDYGEQNHDAMLLAIKSLQQEIDFDDAVDDAYDQGYNAGYSRGAMEARGVFE